MPFDEVICSDLVVDTTKKIVKSMLETNKSALKKSDFVNPRFNSSTWQIFI